MNLSLSLVAVLLVVGSAEVALRVVQATRGPQTEGTTFADYSVHDPLLGWRKQPNVRLSFTRREYTVPFETNAQGLRDVPRSYQAPPGVFRVLALGDSFVEGYTVPLDQTVTQQLQGQLERRGVRSEVINGATTGYSTDQEYLFYRSEGVRYEPEVVLLFLYYNDILWNEKQQYMGGVPKPVFVFRDGHLKLYKERVPTPEPVSRSANAAREAGEARADGRGGGDEGRGSGPGAGGNEDEDDASSLLLVEWVRERLWFGAPHLYNRLGRLGLWEPNRPTGARLELRVYEKKHVPEIEGAWEKTAALLALLAREVESHGSRFAVVYVPSRFEVNDRAWQLSQRRYEMTDHGWDRGLVRERLGQITRSIGIPLVDLTPPLREADRGFLGGPYYVFDGHWNAEGHRVAAEAVARFLAEQGWLVPGDAVRGHRDARPGGAHGAEASGTRGAESGGTQVADGRPDPR